MAKLRYIRCDICGAVGPEGPGFVSFSYTNPYRSADMPFQGRVDACAGRQACREAANTIASEQERIAEGERDRGRD